MILLLTKDGLSSIIKIRILIPQEVACGNSFRGDIMFKKLFEKLTKSKNPESKRYRYDMAKQICGHHVKYVTEKKDGVDEVIGRSGALNIRGDELLVFASSDILMRCRIEDMQAWELLSKDGVVITAPDLQRGGEERTIIVYYVYYR